MKPHTLTSVIRQEFSESHNLSGRKGPQGVSSPTTRSKPGQHWIQTTLLRALSHWVLKKLQGQRSYSLSGQLVPVLSCSHSDFFFPPVISNQNLPFFDMSPLSPSPRHLLQPEPALVPQPLLTGHMLQPQPCQWPPLTLPQCINFFYVLHGYKGTLLTHIELPFHQDSQGTVSKAAPSQSVPRQYHCKELVPPQGRTLLNFMRFPWELLGHVFRNLCSTCTLMLLA